MKLLSGRQGVSTLLAGGELWWLERDRRRERCPLPRNAGRQEAQHTSLALEAGGIGRGEEAGVIPDLAEPHTCVKEVA